MKLKKTKLFNVSGDDTKENQQLFGGNPTGILNLNNVKYSWVSGFWTTMLNNHWIPNKVSMVSDKVTVKELTEAEDKAVKDTLGFLIFLDSLQVNNLPNIADYITCAGCKTLLTLQAFQEAVHSQSYQYGPKGEKILGQKKRERKKKNSDKDRERDSEGDRDR